MFPTLDFLFRSDLRHLAATTPSFYSPNEPPLSSLEGFPTSASATALRKGAPFLGSLSSFRYSLIPPWDFRYFFSFTDPSPDMFPYVVFFFVVSMEKDLLSHR